jgi:hypothetical protein
MVGFFARSDQSLALTVLDAGMRGAARKPLRRFFAAAAARHSN